MTEETPEAAESYYIEKMGEELGTHFDLLLQEVAWLHFKWSEGVELFGSEPARLELLNETAPTFFNIIENMLWEAVTLHIVRLTDPPESMCYKNLTIRKLPELVDDPEFKATLSELVETARQKAGICLNWRNKYIAHCDLELALSDGTSQSEPPSSKDVNEALESIVAVMKAMSEHFTESELFFSKTALLGTQRLLEVLDAGVRKLRECEE
ncbi:MAG: hypothetical protein ACREC0_05080 [Methylocella sp.]